MHERVSSKNVETSISCCLVPLTTRAPGNNCKLAGAINCTGQMLRDWTVTSVQFTASLQLTPGGYHIFQARLKKICHFLKQIASSKRRGTSRYKPS